MSSVGDAAGPPVYDMTLVGSIERGAARVRFGGHGTSRVWEPGMSRYLGCVQGVGPNACFWYVTAQKGAGRRCSSRFDNRERADQYLEEKCTALGIDISSKIRPGWPGAAAAAEVEARLGMTPRTPGGGGGGGGRRARAMGGGRPPRGMMMPATALPVVYHRGLAADSAATAAAASMMMAVAASAAMQSRPTPSSADADVELDTEELEGEGEGEGDADVDDGEDDGSTRGGAQSPRSEPV